MTVVSIHQPNFLPWTGYFQKIEKSDIHIILDDAVTSRQTWINRVRVLCNGIPTWLTVPLSRSPGSLVLIKDLRAVEGWGNKVELRLKDYYRKAPFLDEVLEPITSILRISDTHLSDVNLKLILQLMKMLETRLPHIVSSSSLSVNTTASERLAELVRTVGGTTYLCGQGSSAYLDESDFHTRGLKIEYVSVSERPYFQNGLKEFRSGLSIVDGLMWLGPTEMARRMRASYHG